MGRSHFRRLTEHLHLNDNTAQSPVESPEYDWLHTIRPLIEMTRRIFQRYMKPWQCQSIDEGMIRYKGHYFAKQYTPCKPIKRAMKVWMRCEPNGYTNDYKIYLGKHDEMQGQYHWERVVNIYTNHLNGKVTTFSLTGTFHQSHCFKILKLMVFMLVAPLIPIAKDSLMSWRTKLLVVVVIPSNCNMTICLEQHGNMPI